MKSPAYWNAFFYNFFTRYVWRRDRFLKSNWESIRKWIPENSSIVEIAAGTGRFYQEVLSGHVKSYSALDINAAFVEKMKKRGINAFQADARTEPVPAADIVLSLCAFYQFKGNENNVLEKLLRSAAKRLIILEPVGKSLSRFSMRDRIKAKLVDAGEGPIYERYEAVDLLRLCEKTGRVEHHQGLPNNEYLIVMEGKSTCVDTAR